MIVILDDGTEENTNAITVNHGYFVNGKEVVVVRCVKCNLWIKPNELDGLQCEKCAYAERVSARTKALLEQANASKGDYHD